MNYPKPVERKRQEGNPGKRPLPTPVAYQPPATASEVTGSTPKQLLDAAMAHGKAWFGATDGPALWLLYQMFAEYQDLQADGTPKERRALEANIAKLLAQLAFDPTSRSRLGLVEVKAASALDEMRQRRPNA